MSKQFAIPKEEIKQLVGPMVGCFITDRVTIDGRKIRYMYRDEPDRPEDSGWRFFSGDDSQDYIDDSTHTEIYAVNTAANYVQTSFRIQTRQHLALLRRLEEANMQELPMLPM